MRLTINCCFESYLFIEALDGESTGLLVLSFSIDDVDSPKDQSTQPGEGQQHDGATSKGTACTKRKGAINFDTDFQNYICN